jgi:hypothetical protein
MSFWLETEQNYRVLLSHIRQNQLIAEDTTELSWQLVLISCVILLCFNHSIFCSTLSRGMKGSPLVMYMLTITKIIIINAGILSCTRL